MCHYWLLGKLLLCASVPCSCLKPLPGALCEPCFGCDSVSSQIHRLARPFVWGRHICISGNICLTGLAYCTGCNDCDRPRQTISVTQSLPLRAVLEYETWTPACTLKCLPCFIRASPSGKWPVVRICCRGSECATSGDQPAFAAATK